jgi:TPR repeat protein
MPFQLIACASLPPATISSVPINDYAEANEELANLGTANYYSCCGKSICVGCVVSFCESGNIGKCPFCNSDQGSKTDEEKIEQLMKRVDVNDAGANYVLCTYYYHGQYGLQQDLAKAMELWTQAAKLGSSCAHAHLGNMYHDGGNMKKEKFHNEAAAMAGDEGARCNLGSMEVKLGNMERAVKHFKIAASAGSYHAMNNLLIVFNHGQVSRNAIDSTLTAYNNSCVEMRSEARDAWIRTMMSN